MRHSVDSLSSSRTQECRLLSSSFSCFKEMECARRTSGWNASCTSLCTSCDTSAPYTAVAFCHARHNNAPL